jgi:hypothetical protein
LLLTMAGCHSLAIVDGPNQNTTELHIEVDWTTPTPPDANLLQQAAARIKTYCAPNVQVNFVLDDDLSAKARNIWSISGLKTVALLHRTRGEDVFYLLWTNGQFEDKPQVGGFSWGKRAFAIFPNAANGNMGAAQSAVVHEMFHNLGLVDKYLKMQTPHKHSYGNHCSHQGCLMWPASGGWGLCSYCNADLEAGREK